MTTSQTTSRKASWPRFVGGVRVQKMTQFIWLVPSRSKRGVDRLVEWHHDERDGGWFTCSCPAGENRGQMGTKHARPCWHIRKVSEAEAADGLAPRPSAPPNVSALVD